jgi:hypothetical protein
MKTYSIYTTSYGRASYFYSEEEKKFTRDIDKVSLYTYEDAKAKADELLKPRIARYQSRGEHYKEVHIGNLYEKGYLRKETKQN